MRERGSLEDGIEGFRKLEQDLQDALTLIELGEAEGDKDIVAEAEVALQELKGEVEKRQLESMLSGEADANDCYMEIHAGAGGTEAQDWTEILVRMYTRWAERHGF